MITLLKIHICETERRLTLFFEDGSKATIYKFGKTTYSTVPDNLLKSSLIPLKNVCLRSCYFSPEIPHKQPTDFEKNDLKAHLKPFINTKFKEVYDLYKTNTHFV